MTEGSLLECGPLIAGLERDLGISSETIAAALGVDRRTVERWRANQIVPQGQTRERLKRLLALRDQVFRMFNSLEEGRAWLHTNSTGLGEFTPEEALKAGRMDRVRADLDRLENGVWL